MFLEDGDWDKADIYCESVLDQNPKCAEAYLGKLMAEVKIRKKEDLSKAKEPLDQSDNYRKVMRFADESLRERLSNAKEVQHNEQLYAEAMACMTAASDEEAYRNAAQKFYSLGGYKDASAHREQCLQRADRIRADRIWREEIKRKEDIYSRAEKYMRKGTIESYNTAIQLYESVPGFRSSAAQISECRRKIEEIKAKEAARQVAVEKAKKIAIIAVPIVCVCIAFVIVLTTVIIPNSKYKAALELYDAGNSDEAYSIFQELGNYKDSAEKAGNIRVIKIKEKLKNANVGSYVTFGAYEQDNNISNGKESIEWLVLDIKDEKALLISKYALDCKQYNTSNTGVTWETCTLRKWLNNDFINAAFSSYEKAMIPTVTVSADKNSTNPGNATQDQVFLLSITEANKYFGSDSARQCNPTDYAFANGAYVDSSNGNCWWWLRSPGDHQNTAALVFDDGDVCEFGCGVYNGTSAVRPAMWISMK